MSNSAPHALLALTDAPRALADFACLGLASPLLRRLPRASREHGVMVLPGFMGSDRGNGPLLRFLHRLGYSARGWGQGRNLGVTSFDRDTLVLEIEALAAAGDGTVSLIGHSLGGIYAREIARQRPDLIHQVITLGSPFGRGGETTRASDLYERLNGRDRPPVDRAALSVPPPVPTTAIYTRGDGIVHWRSARQDGDYPHVHNIEVLGSHIGLNINAAVWYWIAKKLAQM